MDASSFVPWIHLSASCLKGTGLGLLNGGSIVALDAASSSGRGSSHNSFFFFSLKFPEILEANLIRARAGGSDREGGEGKENAFRRNVSSTSRW